MTPTSAAKSGINVAPFRCVNAKVVTVTGTMTDHNGAVMPGATVDTGIFVVAVRCCVYTVKVEIGDILRANSFHL